MKNNVFEHFPDIYRFMDAIDSRPNNGCFGTTSENDPEGDWYGMSYEKALEAMANGIPEKCADLKRELAQFKTNGAYNKPRRMPHNYYYGYAPNIPAAIIGLPKSMRHIHTTPQKIKTISILYDSTMNAGTDAEALESAGACILKLVYAIEHAGSRVKLDVSNFAGEDYGTQYINVILLKDYRQSLDVLKLSFPLTSAAMFRRFGFRWAETQQQNTTNHVSGYGRHVSKETLTGALEKNGYDVKNTYIINCPDCQKADYDPIKLAKALGIAL